MAKRNGRYFRQMDPHEKQKRILETSYQAMPGVKVGVGDLQGSEEKHLGYKDRLESKLCDNLFCMWFFFLFRLRIMTYKKILSWLLGPTE